MDKKEAKVRVLYIMFHCGCACLHVWLCMGAQAGMNIEVPNMEKLEECPSSKSQHTAILALLYT